MHQNERKHHSIHLKMEIVVEELAGAALNLRRKGCREHKTQFQYSEKYLCGRVLKNLTPHRMH